MHSRAGSRSAGADELAGRLMQSLQRSAPWLCAALLLALALGCAQPRVEAPPPAPAPLSPEDAIPADLDVALRLDVARMRRALGEAVMNALRQRATEGAAGDTAEQRLIDRVQPGSAGKETDT